MIIFKVLLSIKYEICEKKYIKKKLDDCINFLDHALKCLYYFVFRRGTLHKSMTIVSKISLRGEFLKHEKLKNRFARKIISK